MKDTTKTGTRTERKQPVNKQYVLEKLIHHGMNDDEGQNQAELGQELYRMLWYGYAAKDDTW